MANLMVRVKREMLESCMTCPLCNKLLKEATTISLCLHTFCRKCIYEKLSDDDVDSCPVCDIDLGCLPVEKLRPDHNLQDIRSKIFPLKRRKINAPEVSASVTLPVKRKERSLSSLVVNTPEVPMQTGLTGRRSRLIGRKSAALRGCSFVIEEPIKKDNCLGEDHPVRSNSPESSNKLGRNKRQDSSLADPSNSPRRHKSTNDEELTEGKTDLWTPLNCLVEAANRTKFSKANSQGHSLVKSEPSNAPDRELNASETKGKADSPRAQDTGIYISKTKIKGYGHKLKVYDKNNGTTSIPGPVKHKKLRGANRNKNITSMEACGPSQGVHDASSTKVSRRNNPIWFSLVAYNDRKGDISLPQIPACYLRIKDGKMPVSIIQKYLVKKLDLTKEAEVEIFCRGQPVLPTMQLQSLVNLWFRSASSTKKVPALVGSSAKDFVMVLSYSRKLLAPQRDLSECLRPHNSPSI